MMGTSVMPLTDKQIKAAKPKEKTYRISDEKGLYLEITNKGQKYWRYKYRFQGKEKRLAIGVYPNVTLKEARLAHEKARIQLHEGVDPSVNKKALKANSEQDDQNAFKVVAREWLRTRMLDKSEGHIKRVARAIEDDLIPKLGNTHMAEITAPVLLQTLRAIEERGAVETAHRTKQIAGQIFRYAIATGRAERDPSADLHGALKTRVKSHHAAITEPADVKKLLLAIDEYTGSFHVKAALQLSALWFCRPGELRQLEWSNINETDNRVEIVSSKTKQQHIIPISIQAQAIIDQLKSLHSKSKFLFPSTRGPSRCMSENTLRVALRTMGYTNDQMTPHGFRAMARTLLDEVLNYRVEWIEQQLAHAVKDPNGRAYNRTKHLAQRTQMMQEWADYLDELKNAA